MTIASSAAPGYSSGMKISTQSSQAQRQMARTVGALDPSLGRLDYLLKLYEENFVLLGRLLGDARHFSGDHLSHVPGKPLLWLSVIEQQRYTTILRLTHSFADASLVAVSDTGLAPSMVLDPNAFVRVYHDTRQAEVTHCHFGAKLKSLFSLDVPLHEVNHTRARMSVFFNKWLPYLIESGHRPDSFDVVDRLPSNFAAPVSVLQTQDL